MKSGCVKVSFDTMKQAKDRLKEIQKNPKSKRFPINAYKCDECRKFHLTSLSKYKQLELAYRKEEQLEQEVFRRFKIPLQ